MEISILDYGIGNLHSLRKALERSGQRVRIDPSVSDALTADALVLPGVGNFGAAAARLVDGRAAIRAALLGGKPCLGICLGMQLLFEESEEAEGPGLGVLSGRVRALKGGRVPHIGWNDVEAQDDPLLAGLDPLTAYFANGFVCEPGDLANVIAWTGYGGERWPAAVRSGTIVGVQFHPEKSGRPGLQLLDNFVRAVAA